MIAVIGGRDIRTDSCLMPDEPEGAFLKHIIHDWEDDHCLRVLRNCHDSMEGNGRLVCVDTVPAPMGDSGAAPGKLLDLLMLFAIGGKEKTHQQWQELYRSAGFQIRSATPPHDNFGASVIEETKL